MLEHFYFTYCLGLCSNADVYIQQNHKVQAWRPTHACRQAAWQTGHKGKRKVQWFVEGNNLLLVTSTHIVAASECTNSIAECQISQSN